jgi:hypothetical protein
MPSLLLSSGAPVMSLFPITVALVLDHANVTGGAAKVAFDSALGLKRPDHRPIVFAAAGPIDPRLTKAALRSFASASTTS